MIFYHVLSFPLDSSGRLQRYLFVCFYGFLEQERFDCGNKYKFPIGRSFAAKRASVTFCKASESLSPQRTHGPSENHRDRGRFDLMRTIIGTIGHGIGSVDNDQGIPQGNLLQQSINQHFPVLVGHIQRVFGHDRNHIDLSVR